jgi:hypothetical protein
MLEEVQYMLVHQVIMVLVVEELPRPVQQELLCLGLEMEEMVTHGPLQILPMEEVEVEARVGR